MVDELTGKEAWGLHWLPTWLHTAALERNTSVYPCGHFYCFADIQEEDHQQYSGFNFSSLVKFLEVDKPQYWCAASERILDIKYKWDD